MILTGKCKEDFNKWNYDNDFEDLDENLQNNIILDFFYSVGIYVSLNYVSFFAQLRNEKGFEAYVTNSGSSVKFSSLNSLQEATEQAIIHANKIYNETKV